MGLPQNQEPEFAQQLKHKLQQAAKKRVRNTTKKLAKKALKIAANVIKKLVLQLIRILLTFLLGIDLPVLLIIIGISILIILMFALSASFLGHNVDTGNKTFNYLQAYVKKSAEGTVDMSKKEQVPFMVPPPLLASSVQIKAGKSDTGKKNEDENLINDMSKALAPTFTYGTYNEYTQTQVTTCKKGTCKTGSIQKTDHKVSFLNDVVAWNGDTTFTYTGYLTKWVSHTKVTYDTEKYKTNVTSIVRKPYTAYKTVKVPYKAYISKKVPYKTTEQIPIFDFSHIPPIKVEVTVTLTKYKEEKVAVTKYRTKKVTFTKYKNVKDTVQVEKTRKIPVKTITRTRQKLFNQSKNYIEDYSTFVQVMQDEGYNTQDEKTIAGFYETAAHGTTYPPFNFNQWLTDQNGQIGGNGYGGSFDGTIIPGNDVPAKFMKYYVGAAKKYHVDWNVLAAIHFVETSFSTIKPMISSVGALGPMQFMPSTFNAIHQDGNGDGRYDIWNNADAIYTAAYYLSINNYAKSKYNAIWHYNHADWYVNKVLKYAQIFKSEATYNPSGGTPKITPGDFMRPATGEITSPFGPRPGGFHRGVDIGKGTRTGNVPIVSVADGVVMRSYYSTSYGNCVFIEHDIRGQKYESVYAHMAYFPLVRVGQKVKKGQVIGYMGETGDADGPHLHFELYKDAWSYHNSNGKCLNPVLYIPF